MTTLSALLNAAARDYPNRPAITDGNGTLNWRGFAKRVELAATRLAESGVVDADRVALWLPNSADALAMVFACARLGALAVNINTRFRAAEVADLLQRSKARVLVTEWDFEPVDFPGIFRSISPGERPDLRTIIGRHLPPDIAEIGGLATQPFEGTTAGPPADVATPQSLSVTFTTSGTTSGPKLVVHNQASLAGHAVEVARATGLDQKDASLLAAVPFCGTFGLAAALAAVAGSAQIVCMDRFDGAEAVALIRRHTITHAIGGDDMLARIIEASAGVPFSSMRWFGFAAFSSSAPATALAADAIGLAPHGVYGSSEVQALFSISHGADRLRSGGRPVSNDAVVSVRDPQTGEPLPAGNSGELCFKALSRFLGYLNDDAATARATTSDGSFRSGDLGRLEGDSFIFEARLGDTLRLGGFMVNPEEIEGFLVGLPGVSGAQVVGVEQAGALKPVAFVTTDSDEAFDEARLLRCCAESIARFKVPVRIIAIDEFPVTDGPNGRKIQRIRLREMETAMLKE